MLKSRELGFVLVVYWDINLTKIFYEMNQTQLTREELEPYRSKLYSLNSDNGWVDQGTGFPQILEGVCFSKAPKRSSLLIMNNRIEKPF